MRSILLSLVVLGMCAGAAHAQAQVRISGTITDGNGTRLEGAAVAVRSAADSSLLTGVLADRRGGFAIAGLPAGRYELRVSLIGYTPIRLTVDATAGARQELGMIQLALQPVALDGIDAQSARAPIVLAADRTVYNTREMPAAAGGTAADVLRHIDELEVDFNGRVTMRGDQSVAIHINGRPAPMRGDQLQEFLRQMPGRAIARVEVIPNPSARHDPEGMGGIVNLVLRDDSSLGLSGSVGANASTVGATGLNTRVAYQKGRLTLFGGASGTLSGHDNDGYDLRQNLMSSPANYFEQRSTSKNDNIIGFGDYSVEYRLGEHTTAWTNGYASAHAHETATRTDARVFVDPEQATDWYTQQIDSESPHTFVDWGIGLKRKVGTRGPELIVDLRRTDNSARNGFEAVRVESAASERVGERSGNSSQEYNGLWTFRTDYTRPLRLGEISAGVALARRSIDENGDAQLPTGDLETRFEYREAVDAAYVTGAMNVGRVSVQAGLRAELASTRFEVDASGESYENEYRSLFPTLNLAYKLDAARTLRLGYSKRVGRPPVHGLNPNRVSWDPTLRIVGNPELGPNYTHTINGDFSWTGSRGTLRVAPYFRYTAHNWEQIRALDASGVVTMRWANSASNRQLGSTLTLSRPASGRIGGSVNVAVYRNTTDATNLDPNYRRTSLRWSAGGNATVRVSALAVATLNANYMAPRDLPQGRASGMLNSSLGLRQQVFNRQATVSLFVNDPFDLHRSDLRSSDLTFVQLARTRPRMRAANLSVTWNFGRSPQQQSRRDTDVPGT